MRIIKPGENSWRMEQASRAAYIIDGEEYFSIFKEAVERAQRSIIILGWDIDSRLRLIRKDEENPDPVRLGGLLEAAIEEKPDLEVRILIWDYTFIKVMERELWLSYKLNWKTHSRLTFKWDAKHPLGASHHQKIVAIDDKLAFAGGIDLGKWRWDTTDHKAEDPERVDPLGDPYGPHHDIQMMVEGDAAKALGDLARERWYRACGEKLSPLPADLSTTWPANFKPHFENVTVAISRTVPKYLDYPEVREIEKLYQDAIARARDFIYIENQYTTSHVVGDAIVSRLAEEDGPEIVIVTHMESDGWLEKNTMDVLRSRWLAKIRAADRHNRLRVYYPHLPGYDRQRLTVHAKVMVVDDSYIQIGSANLCNRSMGLDTECDLSLEAQGNQQTKEAITQFRYSLLAEHSGMTTQEIAELLSQHHSMIQAIDSLTDRERALKPLDGSVPSWQDRQVPHSSMIDPEKAVDSNWFRDQIVTKEFSKGAVWVSLRFIVTIVVLVGMAAAWRWTPLNQVADLDNLLDFFGSLHQNAWLPLMMIAGFIFGGCIGLPVTLMVTLMAIVYGPWKAFFMSYTATLASASLSFALGNYLGKEVIEKYVGQKIREISRKVAKQGVIFIALLRLLPIAPFTVINTVAGASHVRFKDFFLGTLLGSVPGTIAVTFFVDQITLAASDPRPKHFAIASAIGLVFIGISILFKRWVGGQTDENKQAKIDG